MSEAACSLQPPEAIPTTTSTTEPTPTPTEPPTRKKKPTFFYPHRQIIVIVIVADILCDFENGLCDWKVRSTDPDSMYNWFHGTAESLEASSVPSPPYDYHEDKTKYFMIASDHLGSTAPAESFTILESPIFLGRDHPIECYSFWFYFGVGSAFYHFFIQSHLLILRTARRSRRVFGGLRDAS